MEPGPAHLPLLPAARAAGPTLQEQPWRQVDMLLPHPATSPSPSLAVLPHLSCKGGWGPTWQSGKVTLRKRREGLAYPSETGKARRIES